MTYSAAIRCSFMKATKKDLPAVNALIQDSKASWGYAPELLAMWREGLTIRESHLSERELYKGLTPDGLICCVYSFSKTTDGVFELEECFVEPRFHGLGLGNQIMTDLFARLNELGAKKVIIVADPNAVGFYRKYGANQVGTYPSIPEGRQLPVLEIEMHEKG
ncbi:hypothetical protein TUMSATVNIG1_40970 [Vibrio nigripulchritudo]|uniref:GNAT family N-acetyltransferase n=1 Tax=Vibrio nigripulchritudo TaxID=28173 RepID=UPI00190DCACD|nr:GNAT family N-acetyltransferase [Vibrio nigripulchritudo]BCL72130.1 hypothetical protein VNTUMSATTG_40670 [Vibrio nigripulchritudo]BDU33488.1 hypothetical protein TUMSATVNIG1_40970 [Vibrio nigripulchritudo]